MTTDRQPRPARRPSPRYLRRGMLGSAVPRSPFALTFSALVLGLAMSSSARAVPVPLNDPSFENVGDATPNSADNTNYRNWGPNNNVIGTYNAGAGAGNNASKWLIRGFTVDNLTEGDFRQTAISGKTDAQFLAYAVVASTAERGVVQYVNALAPFYQGNFQLKVDVYAPVTATNEYLIGVFAFNNPNDVRVDVGGDPTIVTYLGSGGFEKYTSGWLTTTASGVFVEKTLSGAFSGTYQYIGVFMGARLTGSGATDLVGFDNVRLQFQTVPEPSTAAMGLLGLCALAGGAWRKRTLAN